MRIFTLVEPGIAVVDEESSQLSLGYCLVERVMNVVPPEVICA
jgi:hypothetical protein